MKRQRNRRWLGALQRLKGYLSATNNLLNFYILLSGLLHFGIAVFWFFTTQTPLKNNEDLVEIKLISSPQGINTLASTKASAKKAERKLSPKGPRSGKTKTSQEKWKHLTLDQLTPTRFKQIPSADLGFPTPQKKTQLPSKQRDLYGTNGASHYMNELNLDQYTPMIPYFNSLYANIDHLVEYPEDFSQHRIQGEVFIEATVNHMGLLEGGFTYIKATNKYLKTYILSLLLFALQKPLPEKFWLPKGQKVPLSLSFSFKTYNEIDLIRDGSIHAFKNSLKIQRYAYVEPKVYQWVRDYMPPVLPIPGGFYIDFVAAYRLFAEDSRAQKEQDRLSRIQRQERLLNQVVKKASAKKTLQK